MAIPMEIQATVISVMTTPAGARDVRSIDLSGITGSARDLCGLHAELYISPDSMQHWLQPDGS
jgi:hypothetical protein